MEPNKPTQKPARPLAKRKKQAYTNADLPTQLDAQEARWFAVYTGFKREKTVERHLTSKGIENFLPLIEYTRSYLRKKVQVKIPLISCYVFVKITSEEYSHVLDVPDVLNFVRFSSRVIAIPEAEIGIMRRVIGERMEVSVSQSTSLKVGDKVEIIRGNLTGLKGHLVKRKSKKLFVVELESMGYSLTMEVPEEVLNRLGQ